MSVVDDTTWHRYRVLETVFHKNLRIYYPLLSCTVSRRVNSVDTLARPPFRKNRTVTWQIPQRSHTNPHLGTEKLLELKNRSQHFRRQLIACFPFFEACKVCCKLYLPSRYPKTLLSLYKIVWIVVTQYKDRKRVSAYIITSVCVGVKL